MDEQKEEKRKGAHTPRSGDVARLAALTGIHHNALYAWCAAGLVPGATHDGARKRWQIDANALTPAALEELHRLWERHQRSHGAPDVQRTLPTSTATMEEDRAREAKAALCRTAAAVAQDVARRTVAELQPHTPVVLTPTQRELSRTWLVLLALALWAFGCACAAVVLR